MPAPKVGAPATFKGPVYLVVLEDKNKPYFLAERFDETTNYAKFVGFLLDKGSSLDDVVANYSTLLETNKNSHVEVLFPWSKILYVRNLTFVKNKKK